MKKVVYTFLAIIGLSSGSINVNAKQLSLLANPDSCGKWVEERAKDRADFNMAFLTGLLSGMALGSEKNFLSNVDAEAVYIWTDNYCQANPTKPLVGAAINFMNEMVKKNGLQ